MWIVKVKDIVYKELNWYVYHCKLCISVSYLFLKVFFIWFYACVPFFLMHQFMLKTKSLKHIIMVLLRISSYDLNCYSGFVKWTVKLKGRIECSALVVDDFHQVIFYYCCSILPLYQNASRYLSGISFVGCCWMLWGEYLLSWFREWQLPLDL